MDGAGQALTATSAETVRKTWWKVCRDKEAMAAGTTGQRRAKQGQAAPLPPSPASAGSAGACGVLPPGIEPVEPDLPDGRYQFRLSGGPKIWTKDELKPE